MTTSRLSKEQIAFSLRRSEGGTPTVDLLEARTAAMPVSMIVDCGLEFTSKALDDTWVKIKAWCVGYHPQRTQGSPGHLTASEFVRNRQENRTRKLAARWIEAVCKRDQRQKCGHTAFRRQAERAGVSFLGCCPGLMEL